jgi:hypothetical protein
MVSAAGESATVAVCSVATLHSKRRYKNCDRSLGDKHTRDELRRLWHHSSVSSPFQMKTSGDGAWLPQRMTKGSGPCYRSAQPSPWVILQ